MAQRHPAVYGGDDKRGFSLRGSVIYPVLSEDGQVLAWIGRDPTYEQKECDFARLTPAERTEATAPMKHWFPIGFHRGLELFEQLRDSTSTDLGPHLELVWQSDWYTLTNDGRAFCERTFVK